MKGYLKAEIVFDPIARISFPASLNACILPCMFWRPWYFVPINGMNMWTLSVYDQIASEKCTPPPSLKPVIDLKCKIVTATGPYFGKWHSRYITVHVERTWIILVNLVCLSMLNIVVVSTKQNCGLTFTLEFYFVRFRVNFHGFNVFLLICNHLWNGVFLQLLSNCCVSGVSYWHNPFHL